MSRSGSSLSAQAFNDLRYLFEVSLLASIYFGVARFSLLLASPQKMMAPIWPPAGIALAVLLLFGYRLWPAIAIGSFTAEISTGMPFGAAVGVAIGNTAMPVLAAYLMQRFANFHNSLDRLKDVLALLLFGAILSPMVAAILGVTSLHVAGVTLPATLGSAWWDWWLGNAIGIVVIAPLLLIWGAQPRLTWPVSHWRIVEGVLLIAGLAGVSWFVFLGREDRAPLAFLLYPFVIWAAYRFGQEGAVLSSLAVSAVAFLGTAQGLGPFQAIDSYTSALLLATYLGVVTLTAMVLAAMTTQHERSLEALRTSEARNRALIDAIPDTMFRVSRDGTLLDIHVHGNSQSPISSEAWAGKNIRQTPLPPNVAEKAIESIRQALNTHAVATIDYTVMIQGEARIFEARYVASGPDEIVADVRDVTERVQNQQQLEKAIEARTLELATLLEISRHAAATMELKPLVGVILEELKTVVDYDWAAIFILQGNELVPLDFAAPNLPGTLNQLDVTFEQSELARAITRGRKPVIVEDAHGHTSLIITLQTTGHPEAEEFVNYARAWIGIPLMVKDRVIGILALVNRQPGYYRQQHAQLAQAIANQAALAIENARLYEQAQSAAVLEERRRLARELHDSVTQSLYGLTLMAETGRHLATTGDMEQVEHYLARVGETAQQALKEMRILIFELRPVELEKEGLVGALQQRLDTVEKRAGMEAHLLVEGNIQLSPAIEKELYRIALEALNNTLKHSNAKEVTIRLCLTNDQAELVVQDNGQGFSPDLAQERGGMGLKSLRERAERLGGQLTIRSEPGRGTTIAFNMNLSSHLMGWQKSERLG